MSLVDSLPFKEFFIVCLAVNLTVGVAILVSQSSLPPVVPLLYGLPVGEEQLVPRILLVLPSLAAFLLVAANACVSSFLKDSFVHKVLVGISIALTLLASITTIKIFFLVK